MELNRIYNEDCLETMAKMPEGFVDLVVTSPPYDSIRKYNGYSFNFEPIAKELFRVIAQGGVIVWIVGDSTIKGSETGTSFRQALYFKEVGFNLHDTMIYKKNCLSYPMHTRYYPCFEYMFILSKGVPKTINLIADRKNKNAGQAIKCSSNRKADGTLRPLHGNNKRHIKSRGIRWNVWEYNTGWMHSYTESYLKGHPAIFPEKLANDHIISWSNENELIYDPFMGSGTVAKMAIINNRKYIGSEISKEYCELAEKRIKLLETKIFKG